MKKKMIFAGIDNSGSARAVLQTALALAPLLDATVEAIHVREDGTSTAEEIAKEMNIPLRIVETKPLQDLVNELDDPDAVLAVVGARDKPNDPRIAGHVAVTIAERSSKPVVVVPPTSTVRAPIRKVLIPLDGSQSTAAAAKRVSRTFASSGVEVVALHVFDAASTPLFLDRPDYDLDAWTREFLARYSAEPGSRLELRSGRPGNNVVTTAEEEGVDMIALAWRQDLSPGRASVVREVLARAIVPVLLIPVKEGLLRSLIRPGIIRAHRH
ncbi:MAG: universal stress protein [Actinomycetota bacterium]